MTRALHALGAALLLQSFAAAQLPVVWPPGFDAVPGGSAQETPFSVNSVGSPVGSRSIVLINADTLNLPIGTVIREVAFRRDSISSTSYPSRTVSYEIRLGTLPDALLPTQEPIDLSRGGDGLRSGFGSVSLPAAPPPGAGQAAPFNVVIPLSVPFTFTGDDFAVDLAIRGGGNGTWRRDAVLIEPSNGAAMQVFSPGCVRGVGTTPFPWPYLPTSWVDVARLHPGGAFAAHLYGGGAPAGTLTALLLGLPVLPPLSASLIGGPPGCSLAVNPILTFPTLTGNPTLLFSQATVEFPLPPDPTLQGLLLFTQWASVDLSILDPGNGVTLPLTFSDAVASTVGSLPQPASGFGRTVWGRNVQRVGEAFTPFFGPVDYVPILQFR